MASTITTSIVTGGSNSHATTSTEANAVATDFITQGVNGTITSTSGVAPATGSFAVNPQGTPAMLVDVTAGTAWITATPSGQVSQSLRAYMSANYTSYAISANASGSTKYDWIYLKVDPTKANNPAVDASDVTALFTSRSSSNSVDNGSPPTYGVLLAVVTVANGATSITNANIADSRTQSTLASPAGIVTSRSENSFDHVASGGVWSGDAYASTLNASMTAIVAYIGGVRVISAAVTARAFTASKDTYVYLDNTGTLSYNANTTNAASPALPTNSILVAIIVAGAGSIASVASVNQGQENKLLPIASSRPYAVTDSLGNLICPRDGQRSLLGHAQTTTSLSTASTSVQVSAILICPVMVPTGRKIKISFSADNAFSSSATGYAEVTIWDGVAGSGTQLKAFTSGSTAINGQVPMGGFVVLTPTATSKTYAIGYRAVTAGTGTVSAASSDPITFTVELE